ncbi:hypothetical protein QFC20_007549 [Naganishia adeliensis]|uniref:Uncharacterized protein n=1 Tax=Naganishia adeliensis TaxID=92952 RepID=A0ACC2UYA5_9TREE|nr:hypothetical protein QFC20_007549 [Naganishia adeliensis]
MSDYLSTSDPALGIAQGTRSATVEPSREILHHRTASEVSLDYYLVHMGEGPVDNAAQGEAGVGVYDAFDQESDEEDEENSGEGVEGNGADIAGASGSIIGVSPCAASAPRPATGCGTSASLYRPVALQVLMFFQPSPNLRVANGAINPPLLNAQSSQAVPQAHRASFEFPEARDARCKSQT